MAKRMKAVEAWAVVRPRVPNIPEFGRFLCIARRPGALADVVMDGERLARVRIVEIAPKRKVKP